MFRPLVSPITPISTAWVKCGVVFDQVQEGIEAFPGHAILLEEFGISKMVRFLGIRRWGGIGIYNRGILRGVKQKNVECPLAIFSSMQVP